MYLDNDANLGALGGVDLGAARRGGVLLYVLLSVGVGLGIAIDGEMFVARRNRQANSGMS